MEGAYPPVTVLFGPTRFHGCTRRIETRDRGPDEDSAAVTAGVVLVSHQLVKQLSK